MFESVDYHEQRMKEIILERSSEDLASLLAYMSGHAGNHEFFNEAFWAGVAYID